VEGKAIDRFGCGFTTGPDWECPNPGEIPAFSHYEEGRADVPFDLFQSNATCLSSFDWAINSLNQSPCLVAAYLQGACFAGGQHSLFFPLNFLEIKAYY